MQPISFTNLLWDRLSIYSIANLPNTQKLPSLLELLSIKETINYQHRNMEAKYVVPSFKEWPIYGRNQSVHYNKREFPG